MSPLNALLRLVFDGLLLPFRGLPPWVGLTVVSLLTAILMLVLFKRTSNQDKLAAVKRRIHAGLFEIRLFNDDLRAILRAQSEILRANGKYLGLSMVPMVFILPPLVLVMAQLQFQYGYEGLDQGATTLLAVELTGEGDEPAAERPNLTLELPEGLRLDSPPVWIPAEREMVWRLVAEAEGEFEATIDLDGESYSKTVRVAPGLARRSPERRRGTLLNQLLYPAEPPLPRSGPIEAIRVGYPDAEVGFLFWKAHWMVVFFVLSMVFAFLLRKRLGVTI